ncbi:hypothetical protein HDU98_011499 [Podochytrium sp. JEL0797]|nr:hypothetical protein HDU98_011499 [Podochytrium sp. JEL0797]
MGEERRPCNTADNARQEAKKARELIHAGHVAAAQKQCYSSFSRLPPGLNPDKDELLNIIEALANTQLPVTNRSSPHRFSVRLHQSFLKCVQQNSKEHLFYRGRAAHLSFSMLFKLGMFAAGTQELRNAVGFFQTLNDDVIEGNTLDASGNSISLEDAINDEKSGLLTICGVFLQNIEGRR